MLFQLFTQAQSLECGNIQTNSFDITRGSDDTDVLEFTVSSAEDTDFSETEPKILQTNENSATISNIKSGIVYTVSSNDSQTVDCTTSEYLIESFL